MDQLAAYSDGEGDDAILTSFSAGATGAETASKGKGNSKDDDVASGSSAKPIVVGDSEGRGGGSSRAASSSPDDLSWLAPSPQHVRSSDGTIATFDAEWGLPQVSTPSSGSKADSGVDPALAAKLAHFHRLKSQGTHFNQSLAQNRSFRNPHIYAKLVDWVDVDERASAYRMMVHDNPTERDADRVWLSSSKARRELKQEAGADRIAAMQKRRQEEADEAKARSRRSTIDFVGSRSGTSSSTNDRVSTLVADFDRHRDAVRRRDHAERERDRDSRRQR